MVICWTTPLEVVAVGVAALGVAALGVAALGVAALGVAALGVAASSVIVKIGVVATRYRVVVATPPAGRPVPEMLSISIQLASPPDGFAVHCRIAFSTTTSPLIVTVCVANAL